MIEIIKHGDRIVTTCCNYCGCQFSFDKHIDVDKVTPRCVECPECHCHTLWDKDKEH